MNHGCAWLFLAAALTSGCASNEALFTEYERPCPAGMALPEVVTVVALAGEALLPAERFVPAVFFEYRSAELDATGRETLARVADLLQRDESFHLFLRAQTDARGSVAVNDALAQERLESVRAQLDTLGVPSARVRGVGIGKREAVPGADVQEMDAARRVDLQFVDVSGRPLSISVSDES